MSGNILTNDQGGSQSYCCSGFVPSSFANTDSLNLIGEAGLTKRGTGVIASPGTNSNPDEAIVGKELFKRKGGSWSDEDPTCIGFTNFFALVLGEYRRGLRHVLKTDY